MDYLSQNIGINLNRIRKQKSMSLDGVSEQTGVSKSMLAQIEKGTANPSIGVLGKIVSGLQLTFDDLISTPPLADYVVHVDEMSPTKELSGSYRVWTCFPITDNTFVEIYRIEIEPHSEYRSGGHGEKTMEYISVTQGELTVEIGEKKIKVGHNDVLRFETYEDHIYHNYGDEKVEFMVTFVVAPR